MAKSHWHQNRRRSKEQLALPNGGMESEKTKVGGHDRTKKKQFLEFCRENVFLYSGQHFAQFVIMEKTPGTSFRLSTEQIYQLVQTPNFVGSLKMGQITTYFFEGVYVFPETLSSV